MDKSKLIAIIVLVVGLGAIAAFKEKPLPADDDDDHHDAQPTAQVQNTPNYDVAGGVKELQIVDVSKGSGTVAKAGDTVEVNYRGTLLNGDVFDESTGKAPIKFTLGTGQVIPGWDKGIAGMKIGGKRQLTIPASLAYEDQPAGGGKIPPGSTLKFDVELVTVNGKG